MATITEVLTLTQWLSPAYPVGAFAYSHGLEALVSSGTVQDVTDLRDWLEDVLRHGTGHSDTLLLAAAWHAKDADAVNLIDATARALAASRGRLFESDQIGVAFGNVTTEIWGGALRNLTYPVALGRAAGIHALPLALTQAMFLHAMLSNLICAAQRLLAIGQTQAQRLLHTLTPLCNEIAEATKHGDIDKLSSCAFLADIGSMHHETLNSRIFRT